MRTTEEIIKNFLENKNCKSTVDLPREDIVELVNILNAFEIPFEDIPSDADDEYKEKYISNHMTKLIDHKLIIRMLKIIGKYPFDEINNDGMFPASEQISGDSWFIT